MRVVKGEGGSRQTRRKESKREGDVRGWKGMRDVCAAARTREQKREGGEWRKHGSKDEVLRSFLEDEEEQSDGKSRKDQEREGGRE